MKNKLLLCLLFISVISFGQVKYTHFPKSKLEDDLTYFSEKVTTIHPIFLDSTFKIDWDNKIENAKSQLSDSMTQNEFYLFISPILASLYDGHSNFVCPYEQRMKFMNTGGFAFPFSVSLHDSSIYISQYFGAEEGLFKGGEEIIEINRIPSSEILKAMQKLIGDYSINMKNKAIEPNFRSLLWMIYGFQDDYELRIKDNSNKITKLYVNGITNQRFMENKLWYTSTKDNPYSLSIDTLQKIFVLKIHSFADLNSFCAFADSAFEIIAASKTKNLIIDIRDNGGGRSIVVDSLMNYLTDKPYSQYLKIETRISFELKDYYKNHYPEKFQQIKSYPINYLAVSPGDRKNPLSTKNRFSGNLYLLTNGTTYSGAATFAGLIKEMKSGIIIGEETGGKTIYYADFWQITLPVTGLQFYISPKRFTQYGGTDITRGVIPDYIIPDKNDSILSFTRQLIEKK
jgi:hypothetical protein